MRKLLAKRLGSGPKRRGSLPRFRGQFETLESRTVLSATIGVMAFDADANTLTIAVWQIPSNPSAWLQKPSVGEAPPVAYGSANSAWHPGGGDRLFHQKMTGMLGAASIDAGGDFEKPPLRATYTDDNKQPLRSQALPEPDPGTGALNFHFDLEQTGGFVNSAFTQIRYARTLPSGALTYAPVPLDPSTPTSSLSQPSTLVTTDAGFDKYTTNSLLLTAADGLDDNHSSDDKFGDADSLDDEKTTTDSTDSFAAEELAASLDALQRERKAIDAVLAELHDVKLKENDQQSSAAADEQHRTADSPSTTKEFFSAEVRNAHQTEASLADGGMVLLQPTGDPNSSAYDLTDVFFARLGGDDHAPLAVEASLGMYQAIDVGTQPATNRTSLPIAQPAQNGNPSVSAENAPAKKSEQPT